MVQYVWALTIGELLAASNHFRSHMITWFHCPWTDWFQATVSSASSTNIPLSTNIFSGWSQVMSSMKPNFFQWLKWIVGDVGIDTKNSDKLYGVSFASLSQKPPFRGWNPQPYHSSHLKHWGWFRWVSFWGREIRHVLVWVCVVLGRSPRPKKSRQMQTRHELFVALQHPQLQLLDVQSARISSFLPQIWIANTEALWEVWTMCGVLRRYKKYMMLTWLESKVLYTLYWPHSLHSVKLP